MGGYELGIAMDIFRGRYRTGLEHADRDPGEPGRALRVRAAARGSRVREGPPDHGADPVDWFPFYDRNPQTFVDNIFFAKPGDYNKATQRVYHQPKAASAVELPIVP